MNKRVTKNIEFTVFIDIINNILYYLLFMIVPELIQNKTSIYELKRNHRSKLLKPITQKILIQIRTRSCFALVFFLVLHLHYSEHHPSLNFLQSLFRFLHHHDQHELSQSLLGCAHLHNHHASIYHLPNDEDQVQVRLYYGFHYPQLKYQILVLLLVF